jgi:hypothetical protein
MGQRTGLLRVLIIEGGGPEGGGGRKGLLRDMMKFIKSLIFDRLV